MASVMSSIRVKVLTPNLGGIVEGVDLTQALDGDTVSELRAALNDKGVLVFRGQDLREDQLERFAGYFGRVITEPSNASYGGDPKAPVVHGGDTGTHKAVTEVWHADATWLERPPTFTALRMVQPAPNGGGDTCWTNVAAAYEGLIPPIREMLDQLQVTHWMSRSLEAMNVSAQDDKIQWTHPMISVHPETGRKAIFASEGWTRCIPGIPAAQSAHLLAMIYSHIYSPLYVARWHWADDDVVIWDNRTVQHFAVPDYESGRIIRRCVTEGWKPKGPQGER